MILDNAMVDEAALWSSLNAFGTVGRSVFVGHRVLLCLHLYSFAFNIGGYIPR